MGGCWCDSVGEGVCGWDSLDCCCKACVYGGSGGGGVCMLCVIVYDCVGEVGSVWVGQP